jgi:hypothetical protein
MLWTVSPPLAGFCDATSSISRVRSAEESLQVALGLGKRLLGREQDRELQVIARDVNDRTFLDALDIGAPAPAWPARSADSRWRA